MFKYFKLAVLLITVLALSACGERVEVPAGHVAKIMGTNGYQNGIRTTSKFRLPKCWGYCDKLVLMNVTDSPVTEKMTLLMPIDKLEMTFDIRLTLAVNPEKYEELFTKLPPQDNGDVAVISLTTAYNTYAQPIIRTVAREFLSKYSIEQVMSSREAINNELAVVLTKAINAKTPFQVRYAGLGEIEYPPIIKEAQENTAKRREAIQQEEAQLQISRVELERQLQEAKLQRAVDVEKAEAEAEVNRILADSVTTQYVRYRELNNQELLAKTAGNKTVFVPTDMLRTTAGQVKLGSE